MPPPKKKDLQPSAENLYLNKLAREAVYWRVPFASLTKDPPPVIRIWPEYLVPMPPQGAQETAIELAKQNAELLTKLYGKKGATKHWKKPPGPADPNDLTVRVITSRLLKRLLYQQHGIPGGVLEILNDDGRGHFGRWCSG